MWSSFWFLALRLTFIRNGNWEKHFAVSSSMLQFNQHFLWTIIHISALQGFIQSASVTNCIVLVIYNFVSQNYFLRTTWPVSIIFLHILWGLGLQPKSKFSRVVFESHYFKVIIKILRLILGNTNFHKLKIYLVMQMIFAKQISEYMFFPDA